MKNFVSVIIPASGSSTRMKGINKTILMLDGIPVAVRSAMAFDKIESVGEIVFSTTKECESVIEKYAEENLEKPFKIVRGGLTRQQSVYNGFLSCNEKADLICVHDGARPLVTEEVIKNAIENASVYKAAVAAVAVKDTIKVASGGFVEKTPERSALFAAQTPQVFKADLYKRAFEAAIESGAEFTDDSALVENIGVKPFLSSGDYTNIKITTPDDVLTANEILKSRV